MTKAESDALQRAMAKDVASQWWKPQRVGDFVLGDLLATSEQESMFTESGKKTGPKKVQTVLELDRGTLGTIRVSCNVVLQNAIESNSVKPGDRILIAYRGKAKSGKRGKPANLFTLEVIERGAVKGKARKARAG